MASERLPIEVAEQVIDALGAEIVLAEIGRFSALTTLTSCARVHTRWLPRSRIHIWRKVKIFSLERLHSICETLQRSSDLRLWVHSVQLIGKFKSNYSEPSEPSFPWVAPVVLLPYLAHIDTWEIKSCRDVFPPAVLACFRQYTAVKTLVITRSQFLTPLHVYRLAHAFPALHSLELLGVECKALSPDRALISIRTCGRLSHLKLYNNLKSEDPHQLPQLFEVLSGSRSTLTHLELSLEWLFVEGLTLASCTSLEHLSVTVAEDDDLELFSDTAELQALNMLMCLGLPKSLQALEITLDKSLTWLFGFEGSSDQQTVLRNFTRLVTEHIFLGTNGVKIIVRDSTQNLVNTWRASLERTFASLHKLKLLQVDFVHSEGFSPELYGHPTEVEHLTISRDGRSDVNTLAFSPSNTRLFGRLRSQIVVFCLPHVEQEGHGSDSEPRETGIIEDPEGGDIVASSWSPDSAQILALMSDSALDLHVWDVEDLTLLRLIRCTPIPSHGNFRMSTNSHYALILLADDDSVYYWRPDDRVYVVNLVSGEIHHRLVKLQVVSQAVLRCGSECGDFTVLALTKYGIWGVEALVVDRSEEDALGSSTAPPALSPLFGFTPKALSADGTRALCFVDAVSPFPIFRTSAPPWFCVVDTATGEILSGPFEGDRPLKIVGEHPRMDIKRPGSHSPYRGGWIWSTQHGRLYRTPGLDHEQDVGRVEVTYDGSMVVWSDSRGVVHFHRNVGDDATPIPGRVGESEGASVELGKSDEGASMELRKSDEGTSTRGKDVRRRWGGWWRDVLTRKRGREDNRRGKQTQD
ncbi:uncharacterized protein BXZ73DRAFT_100961 [Epithele typhae]|uniref:uncharacterized protein n=1 Tax=Epithele typhae TaxID=378194 RepID=UPI002008BAFE|nr:uncharacterized protein BXZ73DRAFT_100961 [Epithele typhae]KAH9933577.1 hypothetical protein BXZ73DRAFT_100961 [Epithele typhae]